MIARYEVLRYRRKKATSRLVFSDDVYELLAPPCNLWLSLLQASGFEADSFWGFYRDYRRADLV